MSRLAKAAVLCVTPALAGCTVGPDYLLPKEATVNAPAAQGSFAGVRGNPAVQAEALPAGWWRLYRSPDLDRLVTTALAENTDLRVADANLERSRAMVDLVKTQQQPDVAFGGAYERAQFSAQQYLTTANLPPYNVYDVSLSASYDPDLFGRIRRGIEAAEADDDAVEAARDWVRVAVAADVTRAYLEVCSAGDELAVARHSVDLQRQSLALTHQLETAGRKTSLDVTRSQALADQLQSTIPAIEARQRNALYRLATLTGKPPAEFPAALAKCAAAPPLDRPIPVGDGAALLRRRPDVREAERQLAASVAEIGVATADLYPHVVLGASGGSTGLPGDFWTHATNFWSVGPGVSWELNQSAPRAKIAAATATQKMQLAHFDGVVLGALREVETALNVYSHDLQQRGSVSAARAEAAKAVADARQLEVSGRGDPLATLDAQRTLASAEAALANIRAQIAQDQVALFRALGGGWETTPANQAKS